jgi:hypothetical protein
MYNVDPGFSRGQVLGATWVHPIEKTDPLVTGASQVGTKKQFTDVNAYSGSVLSNEIVTCVAVRNTTAAAVLPGTNQTVLGYKGVVDEYVKPVPVNEVYWLVIDGPTQQPLGTRVNLMTAGTATPRLILVDGDEVEETDETNPAVRVVFGESEDAPEEPTPKVDDTVAPVVE